MLRGNWLEEREANRRRQLLHPNGDFDENKPESTFDRVVPRPLDSSRYRAKGSGDPFADLDDSSKPLQYVAKPSSKKRVRGAIRRAR